MKQKLLIILMLLLPAITAWAAVGNEFTSNKLKYKVTSESPKTVQLIGYSTTPKGTLTIPTSVNGYTVTSIGTRAFSMCYNLTRVDIPEGVTTIGDNAFYGCDGLATVNIPDGVTSIANGTFSMCGLKSIVIPEGVTSIGDNAFYGCTSLKTVVIPDGISSIGNRAFFSCSKLESFNIPATVTTIGEYALASCNLLTGLDIPACVTTIGASAFESCKALTEINIYTSSLTSYGTDAFKKTPASLQINVYSENVATFQKGWADYSSQIAAFSPEVLTVTGVTANQNPGETSEYWVTYYHPAANIKITSDDVEIYIATLAEENGYVNLSQIEGNIIKAGQAVMLKAGSADALAMELTPDAATGNYSGNDLKGGSTVATDKVPYTLAAKNGRMGFYKFAGSALNANKAHLELPAGASIREFIALDEEEATSLSEELRVKSEEFDDAWYDLNGRRIANGQKPTAKGVFLHNGRKEVVR